MWYLVVGIVYACIVFSLNMAYVITSPVYASYLRLWAGESGKKYINFRDPSAYWWIFVRAIWGIADVVFWPIGLLINIVRIVIWITRNHDICEDLDIA